MKVGEFENLDSGIVFDNAPTKITYNAGISSSNVKILKQMVKEYCYNN